MQSNNLSTVSPHSFPALNENINDTIPVSDLEIKNNNPLDNKLAHSLISQNHKVCLKF